MKHDGPEVRFYNHLSPRPRATDDKKNRWYIYSKDQALQYQFIQLPGQKRKYICLDLDYEMAGSRWMDEVMLEPTIVIINPKNTHAKYLFELKRPVYFPLADGRKANWISQKAIRFFNNVRRGMDVVLDGDHGYTGNAINNPFHDHWKVHWCDVQYDLQELSEFIPYVHKEYVQVDDEVYEGREKTMFHHCRKLLYPKVKNYSDFDSWKTAVEKVVLDYYHNVAKQMEGDHELTISEAYCVINSITKWTWNKKDDPNFKQHMYNRGVMNLGSIGYDLPDDELEKERKHRLSLGAHYVNQKRTNQTRQKILDAIETMKANGEKVTRKKICNVTGLGQSTLNRYKSIINNHK
ncbi:Replicase family protein [Paucidesulfovibrio gracilis DSM 16080]|uniref:Replicase family protein n=1 Tax=Paucidesulfovibrio gracilis DSM 16080 TaxID=1121449 RepID=A0A1T4W295_9BACT|nr:replication initiation protein [Paucidesulfovibrio gracilis]SKA71178.1 Replicase family protein [Paucidesulfovibrio gracilis DSM 16080]